MISAINTLNFEINTFKGLDIRNVYSLGKFTAKRNLYGSGPVFDNNFFKDNNKKWLYNYILVNKCLYAIRSNKMLGIFIYKNEKYKL